MNKVLNEASIETGASNIPAPMKPATYTDDNRRGSLLSAQADEAQAQPEEKGVWVTEVYLFDQPYELDNTYTYSIARHEREAFFPGALVGVPFGVSNRMKYGICASEAHAPDGRVSPPRLKEIAFVANREYGLSREFFDLCLYLKEQLFTCFCDVARLCLPHGLTVRTKEYYTAGCNWVELTQSGRFYFEKAMATLTGFDK